MTSPSSIDVSVIIPAKDEEKRLPSFLLDVIGFCQASNYSYEIIVVDDGSTDKTSAIVEKFQSKFPRLHLIVLKQNRGKGYAVRRGMMCSHGSVAVFMDADGSTPPSMIEEHLPVLKQGYDIVIGSRVVQDDQHRVQAKSYRRAVGQVFNFLVHQFLMPDIKDTQCGFKMFRRDVIQPLFGRVNICGFGFDLELLYLARILGYQLKEVPVDWRHVDQSKTNLVKDSFKMLVNIFQIRNWHAYSGQCIVPHMSDSEIEAMHKAEQGHWWFRSKQLLVQSCLSKLEARQRQILDAGCGTGLNLQGLASLGECYGCDAMFSALRFTQAEGCQRLAQSDLASFPFKNQSFDLVTSLDVIEHIADPEKVLLEMRRVLRADGTLMITVPAFKFLWSPHDEALSHYRRYHRRELVLLLQSAGFSIQRCGYYFSLAFLFAAPIRVWRRMFPGKGDIQSDTADVPAEWINNLLQNWQKFELALSKYIPLPFGTTLFAVVEKDTQGPQVEYRYQESQQDLSSQDMEPSEKSPILG